MNNQDTPRIGVFICDCGDQIAGTLDTDALCKSADQLPGVVYTRHEAYPCSKDGQARIKQAIAAGNLERVLVAGCTKRLVGKLFEDVLQEAGLDRNYLDVRNIREHCAFVHANQPQLANQKAADLIEMGVSRLAEMVPSHFYQGRLLQSVMVIGSELGGLTAALAIANQGIQVILIEAEALLGCGLNAQLRESVEMIRESTQAVESHERITIHLNAQLTHVIGQPGDYQASIISGTQEYTYAVGAFIVATGAKWKKLESDHWYDRSRVKTQPEFAAELESVEVEPTKLPDPIVFIQYATQHRSQNFSNYTALILATHAKRLSPQAQVTILFRDLMLEGISESGMDIYHQARELGVNFFRYQQGLPPVVGERQIEIHDALTGEPLRIPFERAILSTPLIPQPHTDMLAAILRLPQDDEGFLVEPRQRLRPGRYVDDGIFVLGGAHQPTDTHDNLFQGFVTSARVMRFLGQDCVKIQAPVAEIDDSLCTGCGNCVQVCPMHAIHLEQRDGILSLSTVDLMRCTGCGNCVVVCPVRAIRMPGWNDAAILAQIDSALRPRSERVVIGPVRQPVIVVLACEWSAYASADLAGARHLQYPANVRIIRMNCSARFDPNHILWAFLNGADGVLLGACHPGDCHYGTGNLFARERAQVLQNQLAEHGIHPERLHLEYFSGDDENSFALAIKNFSARVTEFTPKVRRE